MSAKVCRRMDAHGMRMACAMQPAITMTQEVQSIIVVALCRYVNCAKTLSSERVGAIGNG